MIAFVWHQWFLRLVLSFSPLLVIWHKYCANQLEASTSPLPCQATLRYLTVVHTWGAGEFESCLGRVGNLNWNCQVCPANKHVLPFNMEIKLKVKSSLSQADGSWKKVYEEIRVANLAFYKKLTIDSGTCMGGTFEHNFSPEGPGIWMDQSSKVQMPGEWLGTGLQIDSHITSWQGVQSTLNGVHLSSFIVMYFFPLVIIFYNFLS